MSAPAAAVLRLGVLARGTPAGELHPEEVTELQDLLRRDAVLVGFLAAVLGLDDEETEALELRESLRKGYKLRGHTPEWLERTDGDAR